MDGNKLRILSSYKTTPDYFQAEREFRELSISKKIEILTEYTPSIFQIETTTKCNLNCPLCSTHHLKRGRIDLELYILEKILVSNPQMKYSTLHFMGEPLLSSNIFRQIKLLKQNNVFTFFSTNGILLEQKAQEIFESGLDKISISLDAINQADMNLYRRNADLSKIESGIKALISLRGQKGLKRPVIQIQTIMFRYNEEKEGEVLDYLCSLGADRIKLKTPSFDSFGAKNSHTDSIPWERLIPLRYRRDPRERLFYRHRAVCRMLFQAFVLADGSVVPCCIDYDGKSAFGSLREKTWEEIWYSDRRRELLKRYFEGELTLCRECTMCYDYSWEVVRIR